MSRVKKWMRGGYNKEWQTACLSDSPSDRGAENSVVPGRLTGNASSSFSGGKSTISQARPR
ncbi:MAG: hypothetical protein ABI612_23140, partial [Betaproteobacteria bacterium]